MTIAYPIQIRSLMRTSITIETGKPMDAIAFDMDSESVRDIRMPLIEKLNGRMPAVRQAGGR